MLTRQRRKFHRLPILLRRLNVYKDSRLDRLKSCPLPYLGETLQPAARHSVDKLQRYWVRDIETGDSKLSACVDGQHSEIATAC